ncbi:MAG TPA: MATE family efflux transporter, partial [Gemmatimonadales bacterium]|nr:MATE family efflux transporter [Gemmatimonadales bacterium]
GPEAVATVGLTESMLTLIYTLGMGLSIGVMAMVARRVGEKNPEEASMAAVQGIAIGIGVSLLIGIFGVTFAPNLLRLMGGSPELVASGTGYTRMMLGGNVVIMMLFLINAIFRGSGDAAISMRVLWVANACNIVLAPCFIFGIGPFPQLGVTGAAVGTTMGRGIGVLLQLWYITRPERRVTVHRRHLALYWHTMASLLKLSASGTFQVFVGMASWIGAVRIISSFGSGAVAGYTIGIRVIMFALLPSWGLSNAAATMVGQNLGAGKPERAERAVWLAGFYNMIFLGIVGLLFLLGAEQIVHLFSDEVTVHPMAVACLRIVSMGFVFYAWGMVLTQSFNGAGATWTPTWINVFCFWALELPLAWFLATHTTLGAEGVFYAIAIAFSTLAVVSGVMFRRGGWKLKQV